MGILIDVILIAIVILNVAIGYKKGLINVIFNICAFLIAILVTLILYKPVSNLIINNTDIDDRIKEVIINNNQVNENNNNEAQEEKTELSMEEAIRDRLVNGFKNWNGGYDGWLEWCNTLYEPDVHYNVYGKRLTLPKCSDTVKKTR